MKKNNKLLPDFSLNLFIQAKRSEYSSRSKSRLKPTISGAYWHFEITPHQQTALELLEKELAGNALVMYAAPVFHKQQDLYNHTTGKTIVANSTFPKASSLSGHSKWYFDRGGINGIANPDYDEINEADLLTQVENLRRNAGEYLPDQTLTNLEKVSTAIDNVVAKQSDSFLATRFAYESALIEDVIYDFRLDNQKGVREYLRVELFCFLWKLNWLTF